jgi:hypothetical protein
MSRPDHLAYGIAHQALYRPEEGSSRGLNFAVDLRRYLLWHQYIQSVGDGSRIPKAGTPREVDF